MAGHTWGREGRSSGWSAWRWFALRAFSLHTVSFASLLKGGGITSRRELAGLFLSARDDLVGLFYTVNLEKQ